MFPVSFIKVLYFMRNQAVGLLSLCVALFCGCGSGQVSVVPVKGKLSKAGEPLGGVHLTLSPTSGDIPFASADVAADGSFELKCSDGRVGVPIGSFKVVLAPAAKSADPMADMIKMRDSMQGKGGQMDPSKMKSEDLFPPAFKDPKTSPKTIEIKGEDLNLMILI